MDSAVLMAQMPQLQLIQHIRLEEMANHDTAPCFALRIGLAFYIPGTDSPTRLGLGSVIYG